MPRPAILKLDSQKDGHDRILLPFRYRSGKYARTNVAW